MREDFIELENRIAALMRTNKDLGWREASAVVMGNTANSEMQHLKASYKILTRLEHLSIEV